MESITVVDALLAANPADPADRALAVVSFDLECAADPVLPVDSAAARQDATGDPCTHVDPGVRLQASASRLEIELDRPLMTYHLRDSILVRWWINGRPIAPRSATHLDGDTGGVGMEARHLRLDLEKVMSAIGARPGDTVGVQVLICPDGWVRAGSREERLTLIDRAKGRPRLSPRAEFTAP